MNNSLLQYLCFFLMLMMYVFLLFLILECGNVSTE